MAKDKLALAEWYDALSKGYDELYGEEQSWKHKKVLELLSDRRFGLLLDVGCGTGSLLRAVEEIADHVVGIDLSDAMLKTAKSFRSTKIDLLRADCSSLPLRNGLAEGVLAISVIESDNNATEQISELERVCKEDGSLVVTTFHDKNGADDRNLFGQMQIVQQFDIPPRESLFLTRHQAENQGRSVAPHSALPPGLL